MRRLSIKLKEIAMRVLVVQNDEFNKPDRLGEILGDRGVGFDVVRMHLGDELPGDLRRHDGLVVLGGFMNVDEVKDFPFLEGVMGLIREGHEKGMGVLGICLGSQLIAKALGGEVSAMGKAEVGFGNVAAEFPAKMDSMFAGVAWDNVMFHSHGYEVSKLPAGGTVMQSSDKCKVQGFCVGMTTWGFQHHLEWSLDTIKAVAKHEVVVKAGLSEQEVLMQAERYYGDFRRVGDRLLERLVMGLFPVGVC